MRASGERMHYYKNIIRNVRLIVKCGVCGHRQKIQFHHIKPTKLNGDSRGSINRYHDIVKHPDCYIPICYFCHQKVTSGKISISDAFIPMYNQIRLSVWDTNGVRSCIHVI